MCKLFGSACLYQSRLQGVMKLCSGGRGKHIQRIGDTFFRQSDEARLLAGISALQNPQALHFLSAWNLTCLDYYGSKPGRFRFTWPPQARVTRSQCLTAGYLQLHSVFAEKVKKFYWMIGHHLLSEKFCLKAGFII